MRSNVLKFSPVLDPFRNDRLRSPSPAASPVARVEIATRTSCGRSVVRLPKDLFLRLRFLVSKEGRCLFESVEENDSELERSLDVL